MNWKFGLSSQQVAPVMVHDPHTSFHPYLYSMDPATLQPVFESLQRLVESESLSKEECKYVYDSLLYFRNNLRIPERSANIVADNVSVARIDPIHPDNSTYSSNFDSPLPKYCLLWNLFTLGFDRLLINLLVHAEKAKWITAIAELIALFYKDRNDESKILNFFGISATASCQGDRPANLSCPVETPKDQKQAKRRRVTDDMTIRFQHYPNEKEISKLLKQFTVNFLLRGYNTFVSQLHKQLFFQHENFLKGKSEFVWFISYFLPFISQLKMNLNLFKDVFTIDILCYLTWESVRRTEEFEMNTLQVPPVDLKSNKKRLHQSVVAILEYLRVLEKHSRPYSSKSTKKSSREFQEGVCKQLCGYLPAMHDLRQLFLLQLKQFNPDIQRRRYLCDVITANHLLLQILERVSCKSDKASFSLHQHLNHFCTKTIMARYGTALEDFRTNETFVNDCIFTMMHHVGCDLGKIALVCQPNILRSFAKIWEESFQITDDWHDLIAYAVQNFNQCIQNIDTDIVSPGLETQEFSNQGDCRSMESEDLPVIKQTGNGDYDSGNLRTDLESLPILLRNIGFRKQLDWIQSSLMTACAARMGMYSDNEFRHPITCLSLKLNVACPIVPWTEAEASALNSKPFSFFLRQLGFIPSTPHASIYPRIPLEWSPDTLYRVALSLGPVAQQHVDFDLNCFR